ncbi:ATP-binding protein [Plantactinospora sonchi]|uniref:AAA+ ATPase domain-containing protein n=1 Tax=Plantactinospora sonchi TaxID=1544735 RepID=A0ABU7RNB9_9ACTN
MGFDERTFHEGRVPEVRHDKFLRNFRLFAEAFPAAALHRRALQLLGSDIVDVRRWDGAGDRGAWTALVRFGQVMEGALGLHREVMAFYSPDKEFQVRDFQKLKSFRERQPRDPSQGLYLVYASDPLLPAKLRDWTVREPINAVALPRGDAGSSNVSARRPEYEAAQVLLRDLTNSIASQNLYEETLPVTGRDFFGRRDLLHEVTSQLRNGKVCGIFGLRKTGKTSLVKELGRQLVMASPAQRIFVLRDLEDLPTDPGEHGTALHMDLTASLLPKLRNLKLRTHELSHLTEASGVSEFRRAMQATLGHPSSRDIQMVVALDEIESLLGKDPRHSLDRPHVPEFLGVMRSLVQENPNFNVVISGLTSSVLEAGVLYGRENPLFAWAKPYYMPPLDRAAANDLVRDVGMRMAVRWSVDALDKVFNLSGGHVFLHRSLCARIADDLPRDLSSREVTLQRVVAVQRSWRRGVAEQLQEMLSSLDRFYPDAADVLRLLSGTEIDAAEVDSAYPSQIEHLLKLGLIDETAGGYELTAFSRMALRK